MAFVEDTMEDNDNNCLLKIIKVREMGEIVAPKYEEYLSVYRVRSKERKEEYKGVTREITRRSMSSLFYIGNIVKRGIFVHLVIPFVNYSRL